MRLTERFIVVVLRSRCIDLFIASLVLLVLLGNLAAETHSGTPTKNGVSLTLQPTPLNFGDVAVGGHSTILLLATNAGTTPATLLGAKVTTDSDLFTVAIPNSPVVVQPGKSANVQVTFTPRKAGQFSSTLIVAAHGQNEKFDAYFYTSLTASAVAAATLTANPTSLSFGSVNLGSNKTLDATLTAGGSDVMISSMSVNSPEFTITGITLPLTIPAGQNAALQITFTPQTAGIANASAVFVSDATNSPTTITLSGTGVSDPPPTVTLNWDPSQSQVIGYNVYRGSTSGGPYTKQNSTLDSQTSYVDNLVKDGSTYYYVTTAVNSEGQESVYSNQAQAAIPPD